MTRSHKGWIILGVLLAGALLACLPLLRDQRQTSYTGPWVFGPPEARWTITEFADLECPYCKTYTPILKAWVQQQKDVNLRWHHLPLDFHSSVAVQEARQVECAGIIGGTIAFWQAIDQTFERTRSTGQGFDGYLNITGIENQDLADCTASNKRIHLYIDQQVKEAFKSGITATPTLLISDNATGKSVKLEGPADSAMLLSAIDWLTQ